MRYLKGSELEEAVEWMNVAVRESVHSPCKTDKRGVVIVNENRIVGKGVNGPPMGFKCEPKNCEPSCRVYAVHAEKNAIIDASKKGYSVEGGIMYHARTEKGVLQDSREPRCAECSKEILQVGLFSFVLKHEKGYALYEVIELYETSLENFGKRTLR